MTMTDEINAAIDADREAGDELLQQMRGIPGYAENPADDAPPVVQVPDRRVRIPCPECGNSSPASRSASIAALISSVIVISASSLCSEDSTASVGTRCESVLVHSWCTGSPEAVCSASR